jgi:hypothetical protein
LRQDRVIARDREIETQNSLRGGAETRRKSG